MMLSDFLKYCNEPISKPEKPKRPDISTNGIINLSMGDASTLIDSAKQNNIEKVLSLLPTPIGASNKDKNLTICDTDFDSIYKAMKIAKDNGNNEIYQILETHFIASVGFLFLKSIPEETMNDMLDQKIKDINHKNRPDIVSALQYFKEYIKYIEFHE